MSCATARISMARRLKVSPASPRAIWRSCRICPSFVILPWTDGEEKTARLICSICTQNGDAFIGDPRSLLVKGAGSSARDGFQLQDWHGVGVLSLSAGWAGGGADQREPRYRRLFRFGGRPHPSYQPPDACDFGAAGHPRRFDAFRDGPRATRNRLPIRRCFALGRQCADGARRLEDRCPARRVSLHLHAAAAHRLAPAPACIRIRACTITKRARTSS